MAGKVAKLARRLALLTLLSALLVPAWSAGQSTGPQEEKKLWAKSFLGRKAPELHVETWLTSQPQTEGKVVLIEFWATWCRACRDSIPLLNRLHERFGGRLAVIALSDEPPDRLRPFIEQQKLKYAVATDPTKRTNQAYGIQAIPHVVIIGTDGVVRWEGFPAQRGQELTEQVVAEILDADPGLKAVTSRPADSSGSK
jgi:cytochrome c biogenesis protein CcmG/thiol:disulfide interchange protein DsbE